MRIISLSVMLIVSISTFAIKIIHGPYICDMDSTSAPIVWFTDKPGLSWVEIAEDGDDHFYGKERPKYYATLRGRKLAADTLHRVCITALRADCK